MATSTGPAAAADGEGGGLRALGVPPVLYGARSRGPYAPHSHLVLPPTKVWREEPHREVRKARADPTPRRCIHSGQLEPG